MACISLLAPRESFPPGARRHLRRVPLSRRPLPHSILKQLPFRLGEAAESGWRGYALAAVFTGGALALRSLFAPELAGVQPFAFFYLSTALTGWWAGARPAIVAALAGLMLGAFLFLEPRHSYPVGILIPVIIYMLVSAAFIALVHYARKSEAAALDHARRAQTSEAVLREQNALLQELSEAVLDGILIVSPEGRMLYTNEQFGRVWNFPPEVIASGSDEAALSFAETQVADPRGFRAGVADAYRNPDRPVREELVMKDGRVFDRFGAPLVRNGVYDGWVWTFREVTERKRIEQALRRSEAEFRTLFELAAAGVAQADTNGRFTRANRKFCEMLGYSESELLQRTVPGVTHPEDRAENERRFQQVLAGAESEFTFEKRYLHKDGQPVWVEAAVALVRDREAKPSHWVAVVLDITARKRTEEALRESEQRFEIAARATSDAVWDWDLATDGMWWNEGVQTLFGFQAAEVGGDARWWYDQIHPADRDAVVGGVHAVIRSTGSFWRAEYRFRRADGGYAEVFDRGYVLRNGSGSATRMIGAVQDLTDRKRAAEALRESERRFRQAFVNAPVGMALTDLEGRLLYVNRAYCELTGYAEEELLAPDMDFKRLTHPEDLDGNLEEFRRLLAGEIPAFFVEKRYIRKDGSTLWVRASASLRRDREGQPYQVVGLIENIEEQKRAEDQLRRNHDTFHHLIQNNPFGVYVIDADFRLRQVSLGAQKVFSNVRPLLGRDFAEVLRAIWPEPFATDAIARFQHTLATGEPYAAPTTVERRQDIGAVESYDWRIERITLPDGRYGVVCYFYDLSERERWEAALRESEARLKIIVESLSEGLIVVRPDGTSLHWNRAAFEMHGFRAGEDEPRFLADVADVYELRTLEGSVVPLDDWPLRRVMRGEPVRDLELLICNRAGECERVFSYGGVLIRDKGGQPLMGLLTIRDITDRRRAEEEIRRAHALIESITTGTEDLIAAEDSEFRYLYFNEAYRREFRKLWGREVEVGTNMVEALAPWPEEQRNAKELWSRALRGESFSVTMAFGPSVQHRQMYDLRFSPVYDAHGRLVGAAHILRNVTEQVSIQQALREAKEKAERSRAEQQAIVNSMTEGVAIFDAAGTLLDMNPAGLAMHGLADGGQLRRSMVELGQLFELRALNGRVLALDEWPLSRVLRGESFSGYELRVTNVADRREFIASYGGAPVRDAAGQLVLGVLTVRDVTRQRESERALADARDQLERHAAQLEETVAERTAALRETVGELETFSYSLSHDMRAPLRAMKGFSEILQADFADKLGPAGALYLSRIARAAGRLDQLIQDVLTYSRIVREHVSLDPIEVERLAYQLIEENPALQPPKAEITIVSPLHPVLGHEAYLMQVLSNLVYNAVKFVAPGTQPRIRIWTEPADAEVRLLIQDNGIGIPREAQERMFGMFQRLHSDKHYEGTGIGLTIVRKAVERMGGRVSIDSEPGRGSTFRVHLRNPIHDERRTHPAGG
jgi:PAS domain S-box-containing protein